MGPKLPYLNLWFIVELWLAKVSFYKYLKDFHLNRCNWFHLFISYSPLLYIFLDDDDDIVNSSSFLLFQNPFL